MKEFALIQNKKGQALVEFALLIPVIFGVVFSIVDISNYYYNKTHLEGILNDICEMVSNKKSETEINNYINNDDITYNISYENGYAIVTLEQKLNFTTPINASFFKKISKIKTKRAIIYE